jgi:hypothetical protein
VNRLDAAGCRATWTGSTWIRTTATNLVTAADQDHGHGPDRRSPLQLQRRRLPSNVDQLDAVDQDHGREPGDGRADQGHGLVTATDLIDEALFSFSAAGCRATWTGSTPWIRTTATGLVTARAVRRRST